MQYTTNTKQCHITAQLTTKLDSLGQFKWLQKTYLFGGWDCGALWHLLGAPCINYLTYLLTYNAEMNKHIITSNSPPAEVQIVSIEPPALTFVIVPYPLEHCSDWQLSACRSLDGIWRAAVFTSRSLIASASDVISQDCTTDITLQQRQIHNDGRDRFPY